MLPVNTPDVVLAADDDVEEIEVANLSEDVSMVCGVIGANEVVNTPSI